MSSWIAGLREAGLRLDKFLAVAARLGSRSRAQTALERGQVFVNDIEAGDAARLLVEGDRIRLWRDRPGSATRARPPRTRGPLDVVFEDEVLLVVNKPAGLLSVPSERGEDAPSVVSHAETHLRSHHKQRPLVVHRIDRDTSGLVVLAKTVRAQQQLIGQFRRHEPERVYVAVVYGHPDPPIGVWRDRVVWNSAASMLKRARLQDREAEDAVSHYRLVETFADASLLEVSLETGKRNQIRLQASLRGHPLVGESRYVTPPPLLPQIAFARQALHAGRLRLHHPDNGRALVFEAAMPSDMAELVARLRHR